MEADFVAGVEKILGRKVQCFVSANNDTPDVAVESFVLESAPGFLRSVAG